ncbi:hypothetical protein B0813_002205 [Candidatus Fervidibacteria bacterium JGI MDM2 SSWTFF-3-K9]
MRAWSLFVVFAFAIPGFGQSPQRVEVPLTFKEFQTVNEMIVLSLGGIVSLLSERLPRGYSPLPGTVKPQFFELPHEAGTLVGLIALSSPKAKAYDRIWVDWNRDKKFTGDEKLMGTVSARGKEKFVVFGPFERSVGDAKIEGYLIVHDDDHIHLIPKGYYEGEAKLNGQTVKVGLVDGNINGVLGERMVAGQGHFGSESDVFLVDLNGDGTFLPPTEGALEIAIYSGEIYYLTNLVQLPDRNFYRVKVAEDCSRLWLERDLSPKGKVKAACREFLLGLTGQDGVILAQGQQNELLLPVGSYQAHWLTFVERDEKGRPWLALLTFAPQPHKFRVVGDKTTELPFGPPFKLVMDVERSGRRFEFSLSLEDKAGNSVDAVFTPDLKRPPEPVLVISDAKGKTVKTEKFHYG